MQLAPEIVSAMQQLALEQRRLLGPRAGWHIGDVAWGLRQHEGREDEWKIRLWVEGGRTVAWSWLKQDGRNLLEHEVHPDHLGLLDEILAEPAAEVVPAFEDDAERREALARHGFTEPGKPMHYLVARSTPSRPSCLELPDGFRYRTVGPDDVPERVSIHREVWAPSRVTESSFAQVRGQWPYREIARLRDRGAGRALRRLLLVLAGRREPGRRIRAGRDPGRSSAGGPRRGGVHVRAPEAPRRRAAGKRSSTARRSRPARCTSRSALIHASLVYYSRCA